MASLSITLSLIQKQIVPYLYSIFLILTIIGCCLNILLFSRPHLRSVSCCTYFLMASIGMLLNSGIGMGSSLYAVSNVDPQTTVLAFCKLRIYLSQLGAMVYRWCLVAASIDRFALSSTNARLRQLATMQIARRAVVVIVAIWFMLPVHTLIFYNLDGGTCGIVSNPAMALYHSIYTTVAGTVLPITLMLTFTLLIHHNLVQRRQRRQGVTIQETGPRNAMENSHRKRDQQVLIMLIVQIVAFAVLTIPLMVHNIYTSVALYVANKPADRVAIERFAKFVVDVIVYFYPVVSFCLYTLASRAFRSELIAVLRFAAGYGWLKRNNRVEPITSYATRREVLNTRL